MKKLSKEAADLCRWLRTSMETDEDGWFRVGASVWRHFDAIPASHIERRIDRKTFRDNGGYMRLTAAGKATP